MLIMEKTFNFRGFLISSEISEEMLRYLQWEKTCNLRGFLKGSEISEKMLRCL